MLNKKGFMVTPIVFIVLLLVVLVYLFNQSEIDTITKNGITKSMAIDKETYSLEKKQINIINFAKISAYMCSKYYPYPCNKTSLERCINENLTETFGDNNWNINIAGNNIIKISLTLPEIKATNINMSSDSKTVTVTLTKGFLNTTCG
jgi:hypothetical protein